MEQDCAVWHVVQGERVCRELPPEQVALIREQKRQRHRGVRIADPVDAPHEGVHLAWRPESPRDRGVDAPAQVASAGRGDSAARRAVPAGGEAATSAFVSACAPPSPAIVAEVAATRDGGMRRVAEPRTGSSSEGDLPRIPVVAARPAGDALAAPVLASSGASAGDVPGRAAREALQAIIDHGNPGAGVAHVPAPLNRRDRPSLAGSEAGGGSGIDKVKSLFAGKRQTVFGKTLVAADGLPAVPPLAGRVAKAKGGAPILLPTDVEKLAPALGGTVSAEARRPSRPGVQIARAGLSDVPSSRRVADTKVPAVVVRGDEPVLDSPSGRTVGRAISAIPTAAAAAATAARATRTIAGSAPAAAADLRHAERRKSAADARSIAPTASSTGTLALASGVRLPAIGIRPADAAAAAQPATTDAAGAGRPPAAAATEDTPRATTDEAEIAAAASAWLGAMPATNVTPVALERLEAPSPSGAAAACDRWSGCRASTSAPNAS
jgi:hypothetical protein